ncbi:hypothetical protein COHA_006187 [Chlorella ohadii]|uniref:Amidohydrolase-related domain-containing protein n=1 Tax=Chlorella ohadii TaxID=2649997 RepID=A0AAD5DN77_9CHLO|nr:hypothetical protein COHA_006187 [Chlorella ohadii]
MPGPSALLLRNCRVLDASAGTLSSEPLAVLVVNNRIAAVDRPWSLRITERLGQAAAAAGAAGAAAEAAASEAAAALMAGTVRQPGKCGPWTVQDIDCRGLTLMPGLCDAHVHVTACSANLPGLLSLPESLVTARAARVLEGMLLRGFTTVRDAGGADWGLAQAVEEGTIPGPRLLFTGHALSQTGGHGDMRGKGEDFCACGAALRGIGRVCDGVPEVRRAARDELRKGAHCIKIMASGGVASPTDRLTNTQFALEELRAIVEEAEACGTYVCAHAYTAAAIKRAVECGVRSIEHGNCLDEAAAELMAQRGTYLVPTTVTYQQLLEGGAAAGMAPELVAKVGSLVQQGLESMRLAHSKGIPMCYGSDLLGELHAHQLGEFALRARVLPPVELVRAATVNCARLFMQDHEIGRVEEGYLADLLLVEGNPLEDISVLQQPEQRLKLIVKGGRLVKDAA